MEMKRSDEILRFGPSLEQFKFIKRPLVYAAINEKFRGGANINSYCNAKNK